MSAAEPEGGAARASAIEKALLAAVLVLALVLRTRQIEGFYIGPDDGSYLHSARIDQLERGFAPLRWIGEDVAWVRHLAANYSNENATYQHSYLHQWVARWLYRSGCGALQSLRLSSALTGTLTVFFAWWLFAKLWPARRRIGLLAAAIVAFAPLHVFYSRTGWGQIGFSCFYLAYCVVLYRLLFVVDEQDRRGMRRAGLALMALSLLSFGWQEGVAPYIAGCGAAVAAAPWIGRRREDEGTSVPRGRSEHRVLRSRRTWTWVWSSIPVGVITLSLALFSSFAKKYWFDPGGRMHLPWGELKLRSLDNMLVEQRVDLWLGWPVIVLGLIGCFVAYRMRRDLTRFLLITSGAGASILFFVFGDAWLLRAYMPVWLTAMILAAVGLSGCASWVGARAGHLAATMFTLVVLGGFAFTSWTTLFGSVESPFFVQRLYAGASKENLDHRDVDRPILEHLSTHLRENERVAVFGDKAAIFRLQDVGIRAREDYLEGPKDRWPDWIVAVRRLFEQTPHASGQPGGYEPVVSDTIGRWALYRRTR